MYYFNARWYDQELGRFITEDPGNDPNNPNLYVYGANNPLIRIDPTGLFWEEFKNAIFTCYGWKTDAQIEEFKEQVARAEEAIPGFKYDYALGGRLENQIQLYSYMQGVEEAIKNEKGVDKWINLIFLGRPEVRIEETKKQLMGILKYLNLKTDLYNLTHKDKKSYFYSDQEIQEVITAISSLQLAVFTVMYDASIMGANVANYQSVKGTSSTVKGIDSIIEQIPKDKPVVVIGESMGRINPVAEQLKQAGFNVKTYKPQNFRSSPGNLNRLDLEANRSWIRYWTIEKDATVIDMGIDPSRTARSPFYGVENRSIYQNWNYPNVIKYNP